MKTKIEEDMIAVGAILLVILFIAGWILFVPLIIDIDTDHAVYRVYQTGTFQLWLGQDLQPRLHVLGISVFMKQQKELKAKATPPKKKIRKKISTHRVSVLIRKIFQSILIKRLQVDVDTDDVVVNAQLIPALAFLSWGPVRLSANFEGRVYASLLAEMKLYRSVWALVEFFTKK